MSRPVMSTVRLRNGSSGLVMKENSKSFPSCSGLQYPGAAPCGCQMPTNRRTGVAAVNRSGVNAGTIDSRNGSASVTPAPRRNVRRGMNFFETNITSSSIRRVPQAVLRLDAHLKLLALHHRQNDGREPVVVFRRITHDAADGRHVR